MVYPTDDLAIRARRAIREATELVDRRRRIYARRAIRERRADGEDGEPPPLPPLPDPGVSGE